MGALGNMEGADIVGGDIILGGHSLILIFPCSMPIPFRNIGIA
jgi:hypothetical protein